MKGIVVEINKGYAVILTDDGLFAKAKNEKYEIGQAISIKENKKHRSKWIAGASGMVAAAAICTIGTIAYFTPTDYVSLDVNPSVEYSINLFDRILSVKAANDDGEELLSDLKLKNKSIEDGIRATLDELIADGYLSDGPNSGVVIATSNDQFDQAVRLAAELEKEVRNYLESREVDEAKVDAEAVAPERVREAKELGVTPGKLNLVDRLQASTGGAIDKEAWLSRPVKEINKAIHENHKESQKQDQERPQKDGEKNNGKDKYKDNYKDREKENREDKEKENREDEDNYEDIDIDNRRDKDKDNRRDKEKDNRKDKDKDKDNHKDKDKDQRKND